VCVCTNAINAEDTLCVRPYIVKIEDSDQDAKRHDADAACYQTIKSKENESITQDPLKCPIIFDTVTCWPQADVNTTFSLPCPNYINKFNTKSKRPKNILDQLINYLLIILQNSIRSSLQKLPVRQSITASVLVEDFLSFMLELW
jgi:hypothetical protein